MGADICVGVRRVCKVDEEVEKECTGYKVQIQHNSTLLEFQSLDTNHAILHFYNLNDWAFI